MKPINFGIKEEKKTFGELESVKFTGWSCVVSVPLNITKYNIFLRRNFATLKLFVHYVLKTVCKDGQIWWIKLK